MIARRQRSDKSATMFELAQGTKYNGTIKPRMHVAEHLNALCYSTVSREYQVESHCCRAFDGNAKKTCSQWYEKGKLMSIRNTCKVEINVGCYVPGTCISPPVV